MYARAKGAKWQNYARLAMHRFCLEQCQRMSKIIKAYIEYLFFQICHTFCTPRRAAKFVSKSVAGTLLGWSGWRLKAKAAKGWGLGAWFNKVSYESYVYTFRISTLVKKNTLWMHITGSTWTKVWNTLKCVEVEKWISMAQIDILRIDSWLSPSMPSSCCDTNSIKQWLFSYVPRAFTLIKEGLAATKSNVHSALHQHVPVDEQNHYWCRNDIHAIPETTSLSAITLD